MAKSSNDNILVRWEDEDGGHREGVVCAVVTALGACVERDNMLVEISRGSCAKAVIWDRHRNECCIVPIRDVRLIKPRCPKCGGEGTVFVRDVSGGALKFCECRKP